MSDAIQSHNAQSVREDIAFMRALAQQGASGPIFGGSILLATGLIYATASASMWWLAAHPPAEPSHWMAAIWGGAITTQMVVTAIIVLALRGRGQGVTQANNRSNRVFGMVWNAVGCAIMTCIVSFTLTAWVAHIPAVMAGSPAVVMALYGVGWAATAASSKERWTWGVALLSFLFSLASGALVGSPNLPLLFAAAILLLLALPGFLLVMRARVRP